MCPIANDGALMLPVYPEIAYSKHQQNEEIAIKIMNNNVIPSFSSREASVFHHSIRIINRCRCLNTFHEVSTRLL